MLVSINAILSNLFPFLLHPHSCNMFLIVKQQHLNYFHCDKIPRQRQLTGERLYFGSQFQKESVHHGREGMASGSGSWLVTLYP